MAYEFNGQRGGSKFSGKKFLQRVALKKHSCTGNRKKNILGCLKTPKHPLPHHFSNGPSLTDQLTHSSSPLKTYTGIKSCNLNIFKSQSITRINFKAWYSLEFSIIVDWIKNISSVFTSQRFKVMEWREVECSLRRWRDYCAWDTFLAADLPFEASERWKSLLNLFPMFTRLRCQKTTALAAKSPATQAKESVSLRSLLRADPFYFFSPWVTTLWIRHLMYGNHPRIWAVSLFS